MRTSATILTTLALGALVLGGSATASLARGSEGHGVGASHDSMSASNPGSRAGVSDRMGGDRSIGRFDNGVNNGHCSHFFPAKRALVLAVVDTYWPYRRDG